MLIAHETGYVMGDDESNQSDMKRWQAQIKASWRFGTADNLFIGPTMAFDYIRGTKIERPELLEGQRHKTPAATSPKPSLVSVL